MAAALEAENIDTRKYYDPPVHSHKAYQQYADGAVLPNTERQAERVLSLPIWSQMYNEVVLDICRAIERNWQHAEAVSKTLGKSRSNS